MLTIQQLEQQKDEAIKLLKIKGFEAEEILDKLFALNEKRKNTQKVLDDTLAESKLLAKEIGQLYKIKEIQKANELKEKTSKLKAFAKEQEELMKNTQNEIQALLNEIPNIPNPLVRPGENEDDNEIIRRSEDKPDDNSHSLPHWDLAVKAGIIDFETGNKITGAGFPLYKGKGAKLQRALISYFLDQAQKQGYEEVIPPLFVNSESAYGTGQLPDKDGQMYHIETDDFYTIPTAEVPLTNIYRDVILDAKELPVKVCGYTPCFRREAGSYGKNVRGLNRLHQFDKVEIVQITHPDESYNTLDDMVAYVESLVKSLGLTYRIARLCGKDLSFTSALTYDFEVWSSAQKRWLEVSSVSNFESFQANRLKLRFKNEQKKNQVAHTLNGSALALPRILAALLENYQQDNFVQLPEVLLPYTRFEKIEF